MCSMLYAQGGQPARMKGSKGAFSFLDLADVGMLQRGDSSGFMLEPLAELRARNLDRDVPIQTRVLGTIHFSHAARANRRKDFLRAELIAGRKLHIWRIKLSLAHHRADRERTMGWEALHTFLRLAYADSYLRAYTWVISAPNSRIWAE
jgi:hypothetical protein